MKFLLLAAIESTAVTRSDPGNQLHEDIFRMIESGNSNALKNLLNQVPRGQLNGSTATSAANSDNGMRPSFENKGG